MNIEKNKILINSPIQCLGKFLENELYIKREDMIPYSFGGNKARKAQLFFNEVDALLYDSVVTYGSSHSNHCRVIANLCASRNIKCYIIAPEEVSNHTYNSQLMRLFGATIICVPVNRVHETIENLVIELKGNGNFPYFIPGGGHGNIGTQAFVNCYNEIGAYEREYNTYFDNVFFATGTGTTQAGLVAGQILSKDKRNIIGISIARKNPRGRNVVIDSVCDYLGKNYYSLADKNTIFVDDYVDGYGVASQEVTEIINDSMIRFGIPFDMTYTGKAFLGMKKYIEQKQIRNSKVLFIHTGGTPLFFDYLETLK